MTKSRLRPSISRLLTRRVSDFLAEHDLAGAGCPLVVGVSGGPDSACLLHVLAGLRGVLPLTLHAAHLDHRLRGAESVGDAAYVASLCERLGVSLTSQAAEVQAHRRARGLSLEEAARDCRYRFFASVTQSTRARAVLVGHTADDQAETVIMHILRGSGLAGLRGMEPLAQWRGAEGGAVALGRPLLTAWRWETEAYCEENGLEPRADSSNRSPEHVRNRVRLELLPQLRRFNPSVDTALLRLAESAGQAEELLEVETAKHWRRLVRPSSEGLTIDRKRFVALPPALAVHLLRRALLEARGDLQGIGAAHIQRMLSIASGPTGKATKLPGGLAFSAGYQLLRLGPAAEVEATPSALEGEVALRVPGVTAVPGGEIRAQVVPHKGWQLTFGPMTSVMDGLFAARPLLIRSRRDGDRFRPLGMELPKKLQDFMVDAKIPRPLRDRVPLVCDHDGILWVVGYRIDDRAKVRPESETVLRLDFVERP